jgi:hypothetical protein
MDVLRRASHLHLSIETVSFFPPPRRRNIFFFFFALNLGLNGLVSFSVVSPRRVLDGNKRQ